MSFAAQKPDGECRREGITRPDGIADNGRYAGLIDHFRRRDQNGSLCTTGHDDKIKSEAGQ